METLTADDIAEMDDSRLRGEIGFLDIGLRYGYYGRYDRPIAKANWKAARAALAVRGVAA